MRKTGPLQIGILAMIALWLCFAPSLRADPQTNAEITELLTRGHWLPDPQEPTHAIIFSPDGTCTLGNIHSTGKHLYQGTWKIGDRRVVVNFGLLDMTLNLSIPINPAGTSFIDNKGHTAIMVRNTDPLPGGQPPASGPQPPPPAAGPQPVSITTRPVSLEDQQRAAAMVQKYHGGLYFVTGATGGGSGFAASMAGGNFLVTTAHVASKIRGAQFKGLDGSIPQIGTPSMAIGEDIFCMVLPAGGTPFEIMQNVDQNAAIGDAVVVLGNAEGGGVLNTITGRIVGIGPNLVEIDAPFVAGNSGGPVIHLNTGKVIGVASYAANQDYGLTADKRLPQPVVRRFACRIDGVKGWQAVNWPAFNIQAARMDSVERLTDALADFLQDITENNGAATVGRHTNPVIANQIDQWIASRHANESAEDAADANAIFLSFLKTASQTDVTAAQSQITYDYFRRELADQKQARAEMSKDFDQIIQAVRQ